MTRKYKSIKSSGGLFRFLRNTFKSIDVMGEPVQFQIDGGTHKKSLLGALLSSMVIIITLIQLNTKFFDMINYNNTNHMQTLTPIDSNFQVDLKDTYNVVLQFIQGNEEIGAKYKKVIDAISFEVSLTLFGEVYDQNIQFQKLRTSSCTD